MNRSHLIVLFLCFIAVRGDAEIPPTYRIVINRLATTNVPEQTRELVTARIRKALSGAGRVRVLESEDVADLLLDSSLVQQAFGSFDAATVPKASRLWAANYVLLGKLLGDGRRISLVLKLVEVETRGTAGAAELEWDATQPIPDMRAAIAELLLFIPHASTMTPDGYATIEVEPPIAEVRLLNERTPRQLPLQRLRLRPGRYAVAVTPADDDFEPSFAEMRIESNRETKLSITLTKRTVRVPVSRRHASALYIDGRYITPDQDAIDVEVGEHKVAAVSWNGDLRTSTMRAGRNERDAFVPTVNHDGLQREAERRIVQKIIVGRLVRSAVMHHRTVIVVTDEGLVAYDAFTGIRVWALKEEHLGPAFAVGETIITTRSWGESTEYGFLEKRVQVLGVGASDGLVRWRSRPFGEAEVLTTNSNGTLLLCDDNLFMVTGEAALRRVTPQNSIDPSSASRKLDMRTATLIPGGFVVVDISGYELYAYYETGQPAWRQTNEEPINLLHTLGTAILVSGKHGTLTSRRVTDGRVLWMWKSDNAVRAIQTAVNTVLALDGANRIAAIDAQTGHSITWQVPEVGLRIVNEFYSAGHQRLLTLHADHRLVVSDPTTGELLWLYDFESIVTWVGTGHGVAVAVAADGTLISFATSDRRRILGWIEGSTADGGAVLVRTDVHRAYSFRAELHDLASYAEIVEKRAARFLTVDTLDPIEGVALVSTQEASLIAPGTLLLDAGGLRVSLSDQDALVWVDESFECRGSCVIRGLAAGTYDLLVARSGHQLVRQAVRVADDVETISFQLTPEPSLTVLEVDGSPRGAAVYIDGTYAGTTLGGPARWVHLRIGESADVRIQKYGYVPQTKKVTLQHARQEFKYELLEAEEWLRVFTGHRTSTPRIIGWQEQSITTAGVVGKPQRESRDAVFADVEARYSRGWMAIFVRSRFAPEDLSYVAGTRVRLGRLRHLGAVVGGLAYAAEADFVSSSPPVLGEGVSNDDAPLEEWSHPIRNVYVKNDGPTMLYSSLTIRPRFDTTITVSAGWLLGHQLSGVALIPSPDGAHLLKANDRRYTFRARNGYEAGVEASTSLERLLPFLKQTYGLALYVHYTYSRTNFGSFQESRSCTAIALGRMWFR